MKEKVVKKMSVQFSIRTYNELKEMADEEGRSMSNMLNTLITRAAEKMKKEKETKNKAH